MDEEQLIVSENLDPEEQRRGILPGEMELRRLDEEGEIYINEEKSVKNEDSSLEQEVGVKSSALKKQTKNNSLIEEKIFEPIDLKPNLSKMKEVKKLSDNLKSLQGSYEGEINIFKGEWSGEKHLINLVLESSEDRESIDSDNEVILYRNGSAYLTGQIRGSGGYKTLENLSGQYFFQSGPNTFFQIKKSDLSNELSIHYYHNLEHIGSGKILRK